MPSRQSLPQLKAQEDANRQALAKKQAAYARAAAALRQAEAKALQRRRYDVGKLVLGTGLATLSLEQLHEALTCLAVCVQDEARYQAFVRAHREASAPSLNECSFTTMSEDIEETATTGSRN